jgi:hypothetical protein
MYPTTRLQGVQMLTGKKSSANELHFGDYSPGRFAWVTEFVRKLDNIGPVKGSLGLWNWAPSDYDRALRDLETGKAHL